MAKIDNDEVSNNSGNPSFQEIVEARLSRRGFSAAVLLLRRHFLSAALMHYCDLFRPRPKILARARFDHCWAFKAWRFPMQIPL